MLFVSPRMHSKGVGFAAWCAVERMHPEVTLWETVTPYFERRNIHCDPDTGKEMNEQFPEGMFRFEKKIAPDGNVSRKN